jgi:hypothetical protein
VKIKTLYTCCEQVGRRGKDYGTKTIATKICLHFPVLVKVGKE